MINVIEASTRHHTDRGWLKSYWLFSFSDYYDPANMRWGELRVFNDDTVDPGTGFPAHPHQDFEIISIVVSGELTHEDSTGARDVLGPGGVQTMSAGNGIVHSEFNLGEEPTHFYQLWLYPNLDGQAPGHENKHFSPDEWKNRLLAVASGRDGEAGLRVRSNSTVYMADLDPEVAITHDCDPSRHMFVYVARGRLDINGETFKSNDQARITGEPGLAIRALEESSIVLVDTP